MAKRIKTIFDSIGADVPSGRLQEVIAALKNPDRTAYRLSSGNFSAGYILQEWPNRPSMARSIRMQESGPSKSTNWKAVLKLEASEGY